MEKMIQLGVKVKSSVKEKIIKYTAEISSTKTPFTNQIGYTYMRANPITQGDFIEMCVDAWEKMNTKSQEPAPSA